MVNFKKLKQFMEIPETAEMLLSRPEKETTLSINLKVGPNKLLNYSGYVVYHNSVLGPAKGGVRFAVNVTLAETRTLAELMTHKCALMGLPFGGGKSAIAFDPKSISEFERRTLIKEYAHMLRDELAAGAYIPAPDLGSTPSDMAIIYGETHRPESVTGKPPRLGGLPGRREATGRGVSTVTASACRQILGKEVKDVTIAIQGCGNVGSHTASFLFEKGAKITALSDVSGGLYSPDGLPVTQILDFIRQGKLISEYPADNLQKIENEALLKLPVEILIPAAVEDVLTKDNANKVATKLIVEAANGPITAEADEIFNRKGIPVIPDILANSGGVVASYVEWRNAKSGNQTSAEEVYQFIDSKVEPAFVEVLRLTKERKADFRNAAYILSVSELVAAMKERSWI
ncbi:MAG: Glu/Leu/Phe/Val dehydrogenase [Candidatus Omnitrophica bacterium]|nr:Glu/Leu/Phe/Val dehydrogenase [Candidatus Omnitrophota bacterium]